MVKILISGALGRMGKKVAEIVDLIDDAVVLCGVDVKEGKADFPVYTSFNEVKEIPQVIIDFSSPTTLPALLDYAIKNKVNAVLCATGYNEDDIKMIEDASKKIALFRSANMSLGVNVLIDLVKKATAVLGGFDIEIIEKHHNQKVDSPSGTAIMLADGVKEVLPDNYYSYGRKGIVGKRDSKEIGIHAVRGGTIVGEHDVIFAGNNETLTLSHTAQDRSVFANGAVKASIFIADKKNGLYNMQDLVRG